MFSDKMIESIKGEIGELINDNIDDLESAAGVSDVVDISLKISVQGKGDTKTCKVKMSFITQRVNDEGGFTLVEDQPELSFG